jgi:hypothetical protein
MRQLKLPQPSLPDIVFVCLALLVPLGMGTQLLSSDGDLGRHLRVGDQILRHGLIYQDVFSFTKEGQPFVGYEWLSEVAYATVFRLGGLPAVLVFSGLIIALTYAHLTGWLLRRGVDPLLAYVTGIIAAVLGSVHWLARPHLFTLLGVSVVMSRLERNGKGSTPWGFLPVFAVWANLHGGFLYGLVLIAICTAGDLLEAAFSPDRSGWLQRARRDAASFGAAVLGTLLNPYGLDLHRHVLGWFQMGYIIDSTGEYLSPDFHSLTGWFVLAVLLAVVTALALSRRRPTYPRLLFILVSIAFALISQRNIPLLGLTALPALALHVNSEWPQLTGIGPIRERFARESPGRRNGPWAVAVAIALLLLTLSISPLSRLGLIPAAFDPKVFPVLATAKAREAKLEGRIYSEFIWGGYLLQAWPEQKVFIDGQTDFYGEDLAKKYGQIATLLPNWRSLLRSWNIGLVLVPSSSRLAHELVRDPAWRIWYCDATAVMLQRGATPGPAQFDPDSAEGRLSGCTSAR